MTFSVKPSDFANALSQGARTMQEAATNLVRAFVDAQLKSSVEDIRSGKYASDSLRIRLDSSVSHSSSMHVPAIKAVVQELQQAGFNARHGTESDYDDGPCRSSPGYEYIEIKP